MKAKPFQWAALKRRLPLAAALLVGMAGQAAAHTTEPPPVLLKAARVFDGVNLRTNYAVVVSNGKVTAIGPSAQVSSPGATVVNLGDATLLPGFIELHGHVAYQNVPRDVILRHGVTTVRDVGGPLLAPSGGSGSLRLLTAGPIITGPGGYPTPVFGVLDGRTVSAEVANATQAKALVDKLVKGGANVIKIGLDPGGEPGAPWTTGHEPSVEPPWPMPSAAVVQAVVSRAHYWKKQVTAHVAEPRGMKLALDAGVDEFAHIPCNVIPETANAANDLLKRAVKQGVRFLSTLDTFSHCQGAHANTHRLVRLGAKIHYAAEIAHTEIPWGIDAEELHTLLHINMAVNSSNVPGLVLKLFRSATSEAGKVLALGPAGGLDKLGTLAVGAPADIIAVKGNPFESFKLLEYPGLVMSGGKIVQNQFTP